jgi:hypothetical protein
MADTDEVARSEQPPTARIHWLKTPHGSEGKVSIDGCEWLVNSILGNLDGFDGPQLLGFTFISDTGAECEVHFTRGFTCKCDCGAGKDCPHIVSLRLMN